jgi:predicted nucleic acid-binding protein
MRAILDSGPLIAAWNRDDAFHRWSGELFKAYSGPFYVSEPILTEVAHLTGRDMAIVEGLKTGRFLLADSLLEQIQCVEWCLQKWTHCDLADATVIGLSEKLRRFDVLSTDRRHFSTYFRPDGSALPLVLPPRE